MLKDKTRHERQGRQDDAKDSDKDKIERYGTRQVKAPNAGGIHTNEMKDRMK